MKVPKAEKLPSGSYRVRLRLGGESVSITRNTEKEAVKAAELAKAEYRNGIKCAPAGGALMLNAAINAYIDARSNVLSPSTIRGYREIQRNRFKAYKQKPIGAVDWQKAVNLEAKLCAPKTLKNAWGFVKSVLHENGLDVEVRLPATGAPKERAWLTPEEIPLFINAVHGRSCEIPALLALCSLRKSEIFGLDWANVDMDNMIIHIRASRVRDEDDNFVVRYQNKTASSTRDVPIMMPDLFDALEAIPVEDRVGPVMTCHYQTPYKQIAAICSRIGLPNVGLHGFAS